MFENQYKETFSKVVASDDLVQEVLNLKNKKRNKIRVMTLVAAVLLVCALATSVFAYSSYVIYENPQQMLSALFGSGKEQNHEGKLYVDEYGQDLIDPAYQREELDEEAAEEYVEPHIFEVGQSVTYAGNTLTVDAVSYDSNTQCGLIYVHLENPDGVPDYYLQTSGELTWNGPSVIRSRVADVTYFLDEANSSDTSLALAGYFYVSDYYTLTATDVTPILYMGDLDGESSEVITLDLDGMTPMEHITLGSGGIQLSPIGLVIHGDRLDILSASGETLVDYVCIRYADGSEYLVVDDTGGVPTINFARAFGERGAFNDYGYDFAGDYETNRNCVTYLLNRVVPLKDVTEVIVDGVSYSVDAEPIDTPVVSGPETTTTGEGIYAIDPTFTIHANNDPVIGQPLEFTEGLSSGKLTYSITGAEVIHNITDIPLDVDDLEVIPDDLLEDFSPRRLRAWNWLGIDVLDYINEKGDFLDDHCLVLVYATVESHDAVSSVSSEPTWFLANYLELENTADGSIQSIDYFSEAWSDWFTFDGQPLMLMSSGNSKNYAAFGFYVDMYLPDGTPVDFSSFSVRGAEGDSQSILIPLGLEN